MGLTNIKKEYFNKGVFVFENGNYIFIEEIQYSYDGSYWEGTFLPEEHIDPRDTSSTIKGHKYRRVRHAGDDYFQNPEYIVAEDGKSPLFKIMNGGVYVKYEDESDDAYTLLVALEDITGDKGEKGADGDGWHIDLVGYWMEIPDCNNTLGQTSSCNSCSSSVSTSSSPITLFLSLGDGLHVIELGDIGLYRSNDGSNWIEIVASDVGNTTRYMATDALGTGSIDYRTQNVYGTKGKVYYCADGSWELLFNVSVPRHEVSPNAAYYALNQTGFFMDSYVEDPLNSSPIYNTIAITADYKLVVKKDTLEPAHFKDGSFGDGFNEGIIHPTEGIKLNTILIAPDNFSGFGLASYTSGTDTYLDIQVYVPDLVGNGLQSYDDSVNQVDGETRFLFSVNPNDLIDISLSGLDTFTNSDGFDDYRVRVNNGLVIDSNGLNTLFDNLSINVDGTKKLQVKNYAAGNDGILAIHLNPASANINKGIKVDNSTGLEVLLSTDHTAFAFDPTGILIANEGIEGWHLATNVADNNKGIRLDTTADMLEVILQASGGLRFNAGGGIEVDTGDLSWLNNDVVKKIEVDGSDYTGDLVMVGDNASDTYVFTEVSAVGQTIKVTANTQVAALTALIDSLISAAGPSVHTHSISDVISLQVELDTKVDENTTYGNVMIAQNGLFIRNASDNAWAKLICVDDNFNLGTDNTISPT